MQIFVLIVFVLTISFCSFDNCTDVMIGCCKLLLCLSAAVVLRWERQRRDGDQVWATNQKQPVWRSLAQPQRWGACVLCNQLAIKLWIFALFTCTFDKLQSSYVDVMQRWKPRTSSRWQWTTSQRPSQAWVHLSAPPTPMMRSTSEACPVSAYSHSGLLCLRSVNGCSRI